MPNFTHMHLPIGPKSPDYRKVINEFREWAGPHVYLGAAGKFVAGKDGELLLHQLAVDHIIALHMTVSEMYGSTLSYTAEPPEDAPPSSTGFVEVIQVHMRIDPGSVIWITGLSVVKENLTEKPAWQFQLTPQARKLAIASFLKDNGVDPGLDVEALVASIESEGDRLAALAKV
jgi:hypothetical protein